MDLRETGWDGMDLVDLAHDSEPLDSIKFWEILE
jgi:hypothetical protein